MGIPTSIKTLLSGSAVEWARIEFKETWNPDASLKTICAFANDIDNWGGGYLVIGVEDNNGQPKYPLKGVPPDKIDSTLKDLLNKCNKIQPEYLPTMEVADYNEKKFIVVWAPGGYLRPYSSPKTMAKDEKVFIPYIRKMASTIIPSDEETRELYSLANKVPFDDRINHEADISDLNITLIQAYLKEIGSSLFEESKHMNFLDLCRSMNIVNSLPEYTKPKNVGLMFFSFEPNRFFPYAQIDVVQFPEGEGGSRIIERTFKGPLHQQLREALLFIRNTILEEHVIKYSDRAEADRFFNYPYDAVEEALANAVYHKGYDVREPIEVRILPDRIEIVSHPGADRSVSEEGLKNYRVFNRCYRNRRIGEFLKEMHLTEGRNTGFRKILNALEHNGSPKPLFETDDNRTFFSTTFYIHPDFDTINAPDSVNETIKETINETIKLSHSEEIILSLLKKNNTQTISSLMEKSGLSRASVNRILKSLQEKLLIARYGARKNGFWEILK
ncbi:MAG: putative DNA binding domain-containing protein [Anaerolineaceae bacterium]|nr:putative DNA binding domain-containing protein [Anaerolineaceae bacterium]